MLSDVAQLNERDPLLPTEDRNAFRGRLERFLSNPDSSPAALFFYVFICVVIITSSVMMVVETMPQYYGHRRTHWFWLETGIVLILSTEMVLKLFAHSSSPQRLFKWTASWAFLTESLSVLPYWIDIALGGQFYAEVQRLTVLRLFRLFRLLHIISGNNHLKRTLDTLQAAVKRSMDVLFALFLLQFLCATVFAVLLYYVERGEWDGQQWIIDGAVSKFDSIPACYWYAFTVLSTVGLGDLSPKTALGKLLTWPLMLFTVLFLTFPSIIIANHFTSIE